VRLLECPPGKERTVAREPNVEGQTQPSPREKQERAFRRNQALGLLMIAGAILVFWLFRTNPQWIFPPGWWRL
jgi:hypothetical protein